MLNYTIQYLPTNKVFCFIYILKYVVNVLNFYYLLRSQISVAWNTLNWVEFYKTRFKTIL